MKHGFYLFTFLLLGSIVCTAEGTYRTWKTKLGSTYEAQLVKKTGRYVSIKTKQGKTVRLMLTSLSPADAAYLKGDTGSSKSKSTLPPTPYLTDAERDVIVEMNLARCDPKGYAKYLQELKASFIDDRIYVKRGGARIKTNEGVPAVDEAIAFLLKAKPIGALSGSKGLSLAAKDHADDTGPKGKTGHDGTDGSSSGDRIERHGKWSKTIGENISYGSPVARAIVVQLLVDDGVPSRGHRKNIFKRDYGVAGIAIGPHTVYRSMCVIDYAGGFKSK